MNSILEQQRNLHEESDRLELIIAKELAHVPKTRKDRLKQEHRINSYLDRITSSNKRLLKTYEDTDEARHKEIEAILLSSDFGEFYKRLKDIKDNFRKNPDDSAEIPELELKRINKAKEEEEISLMFSGEENFGRMLDLNDVFQQFINLKGVDSSQLDYLSFLDAVVDMDSISTSTKATAGYHRYLSSLVDYLRGFLQRSQPLLDLSQLERECETLFEQRWNEEIERQQSIYCDACISPMMRVLTSGRKYFTKQSVYDGHLTGKKHLKASESNSGVETPGNTDDKENSFTIKKKELMRLEICASKFLEAVSEERMETRAALERKQTLTHDEYANRLEEEKEEIIEKPTDEKEIEEKFYNPLKLPLGWDGKPIPYWLYKLHGLGIEFPCEICGNFVYMGRKAFERHFQETRHSASMRNLGIPNSKHFQEITQIQDALDLWAKLQKEKKQELENAESMEEFEDAYGNVFSKKTYDDLRRQGLL